MVLPVTSTSSLERIAEITAGLLDCTTSAVLTPKGELLASYGCAIPGEIQGVHSELNPGSTDLWLTTPAQAPTPSRFQVYAARRITSAEGTTLGTLVAAGDLPHPETPEAWRHLTDLAMLAAREIESGYRHTQEQLLNNSLELSKFSEDLRQLHRLSTTNYENVDAMFTDYLETGRAIFGLSCGVITQLRGRFGAIRAIRMEGTPAAGTTVELDQLYCGLVVDQRHTLAAASIGQSGPISPRPHYAPSLCYLGTPVFVDDELWGVLSFSAAHRRWRDFTSHELEIVELMAKSVGRSLLEGRMLAARLRAEALEADRSHVLELVAKDRPLAEVLDYISAMVERQTPALAVTLHTVRDARISCVSPGSMPASYHSRIQGLAMDQPGACCFTPSISGIAELFEHGARCADSTEDHSDSPHEFCWQACASIPIVSGSAGIVGVLAAYWKIAVQPRHVDTGVLEMAAQLAAIAIEHRTLTGKLSYQAMHDALTGLPNRKLFTEVVDRVIAEAQHTRAGFAVAFIDLDRFKQINDHWGHAAGDGVLREAASRIEARLQPGDTAARLGGDEFVVLMKGVTGKDDALHLASQMLAAVRAPMEIEGRTISVTASAGISLYPISGDTVDTLLAGADQAMYQVKHNGRDGVLCSRRAAQADRATNLELEHSLHQAIERGEFRLYFMPVFDIREGSGVALEELEVLLGWDHPVLGRIPPSQFIPIAEECGLIANIGAWVLREACRRNAAWRALGLPGVRMAVNVSALQFARPDFVAIVEQALRESSLPASALELELTESAIVKEINSALPKLERLGRLGVRVALDDFGTGYSSLSYLRWMQVQSLKIDKSFIAGMGSSRNTRTLVQAIVGLAHNMGMTVVAEGVETPEQLDFLTQIGCDHAQGHLLGEALPLEGIERWLQRESAA